MVTWTVHIYQLLSKKLLKLFNRQDLQRYLPFVIKLLQMLQQSTSKETNEKYVTESEESRRFGFEIGTQNIIPLYDVPHLLKGLRNNLVSKDLHFTYDKKKMIASWKHLIQFYELDKNQST